MEKERASKGQEEPKDDQRKPNNSPKSPKSSIDKKKSKKVVGVLRKFSSKLLDLSSSGRANRKKSGLDFSGDGYPVASTGSSTSSSSGSGMLLDDLPDELIENILAFLNGPELVRILYHVVQKDFHRVQTVADRLSCIPVCRVFRLQSGSVTSPQQHL
jgi:hypothetical protein